MRTILTIFFLGLLTGLSFAGKDTGVSIEKMEGTVVELHMAQAKSFDAVKISLTFTSSPEATKDLYKTIQRESEYTNDFFKRPKRGEVILVLPKKSLPAGIKVSDKVRILGFSMSRSFMVSGFMSNHPEPSKMAPSVQKIEIIPKD